MKQYLKNIIEPLIQDVAVLDVSETQDDNGKLLLVSLSKKDMGRVIGKGGDIIKSIRTIVHAVGARNGEKISVKVPEPEPK